MEIVEHILVARGQNMVGGKPKPEAAACVLRLVGIAIRDAASMGFRSSSRVRGRTPDWLCTAADARFVRVSGNGDDATKFHFEVPRFASAAPQIYQQQVLFAMRPPENDTAFDLWGDALVDIAKMDRGSDRFDSPFLRQLERFRFAGIDSIELYGDRLPSERPPIFNKHVAKCATDLFRETPEPNHARVMGKLDTIRHHDRMFTIVLASREDVRGVWCHEETGTLTDLWGKEIVAEGQAIYRPSGSLLRLDAEAMRPASPHDKIFSKAPTPIARHLVGMELRRPQTKTAGMSVIYGKWPGDETEEEILVRLKELG